MELKWADENQFCPKKENKIFQIGIEKIKRFNPDIIYCSCPLFYLHSNFLNELIFNLAKRPKLVAWYGANCGDEETFRFFDLTLSNSKHLVNELLKKKYMQIPFNILSNLQYSIKLNSGKRINKFGFFGNLDTYTPDFAERNKLLLKMSDIGNVLQVYATLHKPKPLEKIKYSAIKSRHNFSRIVKIYPLKRIETWSQIENLPPSPWLLDKKFTQQVKPPLLGMMLQTLSNYQLAFNYHNKHTGNYACNMRLFEATGIVAAF